jgi:hypothetical protein
VQWTGGYAPSFLSVFAALSFSRFDGESQPSHLPLTRAVGRFPGSIGDNVLQIQKNVMIKAYFDTCIISGLAKEDLDTAQQTALVEVLRFYKAGSVELVTSELAQEEIIRIPERHRIRHEVIYNLLANIPITRAKWIDSGLSLLGVGGGSRFDPLYLELRTILPDELDAQHIFQAIKSNADFFVTTDKRTILRHRQDLESRYALKLVLPSELVSALSLRSGQ